MCMLCGCVQEVEADLKDLSFEAFSMFYDNCVFTPDVSWIQHVLRQLRLYARRKLDSLFNE